MSRGRARPFILLGIAAGLLAALSLGSAAWWAARTLAAAPGVAYPGAVLTAEHTRRGWWPRVWQRRDTAYATAAPFVEVYNYYSVGLHLGPEQHGNSGCIVLAHSDRTALIFAHDISVTLCDAPQGRRVYVMQSVALKLP